MSVAFECFNAFPDEANTIGRLVVAYGEIEYLLSLLAGHALPNTIEPMRIIFRAKGEEQRLQIADAMIRPICQSAGLIGLYTDALGATRHCKSIRNQFAHSHWLATNDSLIFTNLDEASKGSAGEMLFSPKPITMDTLDAQAAWFRYTCDLLWHIHGKLTERTGGSPIPNSEAPAKVDRPPLNSS